MLRLPTEKPKAKILKSQKESTENYVQLYFGIGNVRTNTRSYKVYVQNRNSSKESIFIELCI
jgi:hypothetical protein